MKNYEHITKYENILDEHQTKLDELNTILKYFIEHQNEYQALMDYYESALRDEDLKADEQHLIPKELKRGVLSEDGIYDLMLNYRESAIEMMEVALEMIKKA